MRREQIEKAILQTVAYGDVFQYPLTTAEIHRYLVGVLATLPQVIAVLETGRLISSRLSYYNGYYTLAGQEKNVALRRQRAHQAQSMWPAARRYGHLIGHLPFVRMVAVTGSLAMDSPTPGADIDFLIVTKEGRLWLCRALVVAVVKVAARQGVSLCPNYFLAENSLRFADRDLYTAHELAQMIPLTGNPVYWLMRQSNWWTDRFLPNAKGSPRRPPSPVSFTSQVIRTMTELPLLGTPGTWLEDWEMARKLRKLGANTTANSESDFGKDWCKGHFDGHHSRIMATYRQRLASTMDNAGAVEMSTQKVSPL